MSLSAAAIAERPIGDSTAPSNIKIPPPKRTLTALADQRQAPEPR